MRYARGDVVPYEGQLKSFRSFMLRANRYGMLTGGGGGKMVLVDEMPSFAKRDPSEFRQVVRFSRWKLSTMFTLTSFGNIPRSLLAQYGSSRSGFPLVVVVSEGRKEDELKKLLPVDVVAALGVSINNYYRVSISCGDIWVDDVQQALLPFRHPPHLLQPGGTDEHGPRTRRCRQGGVRFGRARVSRPGQGIAHGARGVVIGRHQVHCLLFGAQKVPIRPDHTTWKSIPY